MIILILLSCLMGLWVSSLLDTQKVVQELLIEQDETVQFSTLLGAVHQVLTRMESLEEFKDRTEWMRHYRQYREVADDLHYQWQSVDLSHLEPDETPVWTDVDEDLQLVFAADARIQELVAAGDLKAAAQVPERDLEPIVNRITGRMAELLTASKGYLGVIADRVSLRHNISYVLVLMLGTIAVVLGAVSAVLLRNRMRTDRALRQQGDRIRALYEVSARSDLSIDEQITETLRLGCRLLDMEVGKVGCQDPEKNTSTFLNTVAPRELPVRRGLVLPLDKTFCQVTFSSDGPIAIAHVSTSSYNTHPAAKFLGVEAYIGTTIHVRGRKFGTVNFSHRQPRENAFTETDNDLVNLIGSWISVMMERQLDQEDLSRSKSLAEVANRAKSAFLANMSHEIRTPLTAILGYSEMLLDESLSYEDRRHDVQSILRSGKHLQQIINDILDLSKIEAGQLVLEHVKVSPLMLVNDLQDIFLVEAVDKGLGFNIHYEFPLPRFIISDPTRLRQVLINLCGNAIKFTSEGGIDLTLRYLESLHQMEFVVRDTGIGLDEEEKKKLFQPFSQADVSTTRRFGGTGLGLCISRQLSNRLGGDVTVQSEKGRGSEFTVTVDIGPLQRIELVNEINPEDFVIEEGPHPDDILRLAGRVLVAEDCRENQDLLMRCVQKTGAEVLVVDNGKQALEAAAGGEFDLVLMDLQMPVMDGLEAISKLRQQQFTQPILCISANAMKGDRDRCMAAGANGFLTKPIDRREFYAALKAHLPAADAVTRKTASGG